MASVNIYTLIHLALWFIAGRFTPLSVMTFLVVTTGWELMELVLPFEFALESLSNKILDMAANVTGYVVGRHFANSQYRTDSPQP